MKYTIFSLFLFSSCMPFGKEEVSLVEKEEFKQYWFSGKAEINAFKLDQARYGENHPGEAVLIFVTEDFSKKKLVKLDFPEEAGRDKIRVLKMNFTKNFITGIYPYSMMLSVFTPVNRKDYPNSLKVTMSSQEWCGQRFTQINEARNQFSVTNHSYFESDGDAIYSLEKMWLEDEVWNMIRMGPEQLPIGEFEMIPGLFFSGLNHNPLQTEKMLGGLEARDGNWVYILRALGYERKLEIEFEQKFPFKILGWVESFHDGKGNSMKTSAVLEKSLYIDYWTKNKNEFQFLRDSLNLPSPYEY